MNSEKGQDEIVFNIMTALKTYFQKLDAKTLHTE